MFLVSCGFGIPLKKPEIVKRQTERSGTLRIGESSVADVHTILGEPLLQSLYWGVDVFQVEDVQKELAFFIFFTPPVPMGVFTTKVGGYVLVTYDNNGLVSNVASGTASNGMGGQEALMLRGGDLNFVIETFDLRGPQLIIQSARLLNYFDLHRAAQECTLVLACELPKTSERLPNEACPDHVVIDAGEPFNLQPLFTTCEPDNCPDTAVPGGSGYMHLPLLYPITLSHGHHQLELSSSIFKGRDVSTFNCDSGQVLFGIIHGRVYWHWWGSRSSTLNTSVSLSAAPPSDWRSYSALLYSYNNWLVEPNPGKIMK